MGQATVDLPDPMDPALPASASGTDDLLSQLAGDEIDRLLAEADSDRAATAPKVAASAAQPSPVAPDPAAAATPPSGPVPATEAAPASVADAVSPPVTAPQPQSSQQPAAPMVDPTPPADELDALLSQIDQGEQSPKPSESPAAASPAAASVPSDPPKPKTLTEQVPEVLAQFDASAAAAAKSAAPAVPAPRAAAPPEPMEAVMSPAEREALGLSNLAAATAAAEQHDAAAATVAATATAAVVAVKSDEAAPSSVTLSRFKLAIRLLEWVNVPLSFIPERMRDTLGKVGIVTLVNSIAVLIYVLFIRH